MNVYGLDNKNIYTICEKRIPLDNIKQPLDGLCGICNKTEECETSVKFQLYGCKLLQ